MAVAVIVNKAGARAPSLTGNACFRGNIGKSAVTVVVIQNIADQVGNEQVGITIIVIVTGGDSHPVKAPLQSCLYRDVSERAVVIVPVETIPESRIRFVRNRSLRHRIADQGTIHEKQVEESVVVVIEHS